MRHRDVPRRVRASPFGQIDLWETLDEIVIAIEEFVSAAGVPLCALEDATTGYLEGLLHIQNELLPVDIHWSGQTSTEGNTVVWVSRDVIERLVVVCRILSTAPSWGVEAECPLTVWNSSGPGLLIHWLNRRICMLTTVRSRRPHYLYHGGEEAEASTMAIHVKRIYAMVFFDDPDLGQPFLTFE
jgi:hypothetical protein